MLYSRSQGFAPAGFVLLLIAFIVSASGEVVFHPVYQDVSEGVRYAHMTATNPVWSIHVLRVDRRQRDLHLACTLALDHIAGLATVARQVGAIPSAWGIPVAAVNADFFVLRAGPYQGDPQGLQILSGELVSAPDGPTLWMEQGEPRIGLVRAKFNLSWPGGGTSPFALNEMPRETNVVLFTPRFGASTRATNHEELVLGPAPGSAWLPLRASEAFRAVVLAHNPAGNSPLVSNRMVLVAGSAFAQRVRAIPNGAILKLSAGLSRKLSGVEFAVGGGPILLQNGAFSGWADAPHHPGKRNPRTAAGYNCADYFLVEVDGRQEGLSVGMDFHELATLMKTLGCTDAINLDGGGSSTFWLNGKIMNSPSDKHERAVANTLVVLRK
ncbi:MAG TPA: phosphodiester glycosidase family protein [Verrucomicrobiae bacterium]|nr:phosphodiester glycosidase family protein [Verrucomicrobiae bacterium]